VEGSDARVGRRKVAVGKPGQGRVVRDEVDESPRGPWRKSLAPLEAKRRERIRRIVAVVHTVDQQVLQL
jgi:hypothetical protein